jgi:hypothetical protein
MENERTWRCEKATYSEESIEKMGFEHGQLHIKYYPPMRWGLDDDESSRPSPKWAEDAYARGYTNGKALSTMNEVFPSMKK